MYYFTMRLLGPRLLPHALHTTTIHHVQCTTPRPLFPVMKMMHNVNQTVAGCRYNSSSSSSSTNFVHQLTHIGADGRPTMVNVSEKTPTKRRATANGRIYIPAIAYNLITDVSEPQHSKHKNADVDETQEAAAIEKARAKAKGKGDVLTVAQLAAIMGSKRTADLIPLCHPLALSHVSVELRPRVHHQNASGDDNHPIFVSGGSSGDNDDQQQPQYSIECEATVSCEGKTGVEMEALTAVSVGLLTVWDMLKAVAGKDMRISDIMVTRKEGGKSGDFIRTE